MEIYIATGSGLLVAENGPKGWTVTAGGLADELVTSVIAREGVILAGTSNGVYRSESGGKEWKSASVGLTIPYVRWMAFHPAVSDLEFAGTEPAGIFVSHDGANNWRACPEVAILRDAKKWFLPYSPEAGCIRGFAFNGLRAYAAAEVGGLLRSDNRGERWSLAEASSGDPNLGDTPEPLIYADVHSVAVHPSSPDLVYAPTGGGFYRSMDGGKTFQCLYDCYCRAFWVDAADPDHLILGPADGVSENGRIEESCDGGKTWKPASTGETVPWPDYMVERFEQIGDQLFAVLSDGSLIAAPLATLQWQRILPDVEGIHCITTMQT
jgi:hypothetical protein